MSSQACDCALRECREYVLFVYPLKDRFPFTGVLILGDIVATPDWVVSIKVPSYDDREGLSVLRLRYTNRMTKC